MPRTDEAKVAAVLSTNLTPSQVNAFIEDASLWVDEELAPKAVLSEGRLELVERYLACALIRLRDQGLKSTKLDDIWEQYQGDPEVTDYLLRAASFDSTGTVRRYFLASKDTRVAVGWVGQGFRGEARS